MKRQLLAEQRVDARKGANNQAQETKDGKGPIFKIYQNAKRVGTQIKEDLLRDGTYIIDKGDFYDFMLTDTSVESGVLDYAYGTFMFLNLLDEDGFEAKFDKEEIEKLKNSVIKLLHYVRNNGYDVSPYATKEENEIIFGDDKVSFIESLTWCFSCFILARKIQKRQVFDLGEETALLDKTIASGLQLLVNNVIRETENDYELGWSGNDAKYIGWGAVTGSKQAALYFTMSVCETYGDMEDTILGNQELGVKRDDEYIRYINTLAGDNIVQNFEEICKAVGINTYNRYKKQLGRRFFYQDGSEVAEGQIEYSGQSPVLLNQLYAAMIPIYTNYNKTLKKEGKTEELNVFQIKVKEAVDMVYKEYADLLAKQKEGIVNRECVTFYGLLADKKQAATLTKARINVAILEALIVRARAMIVTYVTQYPEKELGEMVSIIEKNLVDEEKWIWGDLQETERCVSAIKEFYDYYKDYESAYANMTADKRQLEERYQQTMNDEKEKLIKAHDFEKDALQKQHEAKVEELNAKIAELQKSVDNGAPIERTIRSYIEENVKTSIDQVLVSRLNKLAAINAGKEVSLDDAETQLKHAFDNYVRSYFVRGITLAKGEDGHPEFNEKKDEEILAAAKACFDEFLSEFLPFAMTQNAGEGIAELFCNLQTDYKTKS